MYIFTLLFKFNYSILCLHLTFKELIMLIFLLQIRTEHNRFYLFAIATTSSDLLATICEHVFPAAITIKRWR